MCLYSSGKVGQRENRTEPQTWFKEEMLEMRYCDSGVLGLCTWATLPKRLVLFLVHWAWRYQQALAWRKGKRLGKHYREDCGLILSCKTGKTHLRSETSLLVRLVRTSEQSLPPEDPWEKKSSKISANQCNSWWPISIPMKQIIPESSFCTSAFFSSPFLLSPPVTCILTEMLPLLFFFFLRFHKIVWSDFLVSSLLEAGNKLTNFFYWGEK